MRLHSVLTVADLNEFSLAYAIYSKKKNDQLCFDFTKGPLHFSSKYKAVPPNIKHGKYKVLVLIGL